MSEKLPWFQFYATDWISDEKVRLLSGRQRGWYIDLLAHDWQEGGLPLSVRLAQNLTSFREDCAYEEAFLSDNAGDWRGALQKEFDEVFSFFSDNGNGRCSHKRLREQREHILLKSAKQREGALLTNAKRKAGNAKRHANRNAKRNANHSAERAPSSVVSGAVSGLEPEPEYIESCSSSEICTPEEENNTQAAPSAQKKAGANLPPSTVELSLQPLLDQLAEIYRKAGAPVPEKHRQIAAQLLAAIPPEKRSRVPNYCKWALVSGKWPNPAKTKSLLNVLRDGDWDVEITPRILPAIENETPRERAGREATLRYLRSKGVAC